ncbi:MAG: hypothetical protein AB9903_34295 [Vulcanimicrobiota bacterium]
MTTATQNSTTANPSGDSVTPEALAAMEALLISDEHLEALYEERKRALDDKLCDQEASLARINEQRKETLGQIEDFFLDYAAEYGNINAYVAYIEGFKDGVRAALKK